MKRGFLLMNTGSPDSPKLDVKSYLGQFLMTYRNRFPYPLRAILVYGIILNTRPKSLQKLINQYGQIMALL